MPDAAQDATRLLTQGERLARLGDELSAAFAKEVAATLRDLERRLRVWAVESGATAKIRAGRAAQVREELLRVLKASGYGDLADQASIAATDRLLALLSGRDVTAAARFTTADVAKIEALRANFLAAVVVDDLELLAPLWRAVLYGVYGAETRQGLVELLADVLDRERHDAEALYDTAVSVYTRQVQAIRAEEGPQATFLYAGPVDVRLRPFCRARVGKVYTRGAIDAMDNGQLPNVYLTGGGYRCRHVWMAVPAGSELEGLADTGTRVPQVEADLRWLPAGGRKAA